MFNRNYFARGQELGEGCGVDLYVYIWPLNVLGQLTLIISEGFN